MEGIHPDRIKQLNEGKEPRADGCFVLYWMQSAVRTICNQALEYAIKQGCDLGVPTVVCFGLAKQYPEANERHYVFLLEGLRDIREALHERGLLFLCRWSKNGPWDVPLEISKLGAKMVVTDMNYLNHLKAWRASLAEALDIPLIQIETEAVCPVEAVSDHCEFAARTLRPKIHRVWTQYLEMPPEQTPYPGDPPEAVKKLVEGEGVVELDDIPTVIDKLPIDKSVKPSEKWKGGQKNAQAKLAEFLERLNKYHTQRNDVNVDGSSQLSMYLHYGHISPIQCVIEANKKSRSAAESFVEEIVVRRELSFNHCFFNPGYDKLKSAVPDWALRTMSKHAKDKRQYEYTYEELEACKTHDPYWNAATTEMIITGRMPNYLRMYWGKKILEWSSTYEIAWDSLERLNNKFLIDGRDANSWCNFAWIFGAKDRPWSPEREVFGQLRYMNSEGLKRKFDMVTYVHKVAKLSGPHKGPLDRLLTAAHIQTAKQPEAEAEKEVPDEGPQNKRAISDEDECATNSEAPSHTKTKRRKSITSND